MNTLFAAIFLVYVGYVKSTTICDGTKDVEWVPDPSDCSVFYLCFGDLQQKYSCPEDTVYNVEQRMCVKKGSPGDKCVEKKQETITEKCKNTGHFLLPHESDCAKYIDCTTNTVEECYYPFLFDNKRNRCAPPSLAECGKRTVPKDPCDYTENECRSIQGCIPCAVRLPSCKGLSDGLNPWPEREGSPYYVVCKNERVVYHDQCDYEHKNEIFHPKKRACLTM